MPDRPAIVSPSNAAEATPLETKRESEKDMRAEKEQVHKADPGEVAMNPEKEQQKTNPIKEQSPVRRHEPVREVRKERQQTETEKKEISKENHEPAKNHRGILLKLDDATAVTKFGEDEKPLNPADSLNQKLQGIGPVSLKSYRAFSRPSGSGARFMGQSGSMDYLPNLPDGDITFLNAKASTYAGFVRRVAIQVFGALRASGWENLTYRDISMIQDFATVRAILSKEGKLLKVELLKGSGNGSFDETVVQASRTGARDPNPPQGSEAADGTIHFIFQARSWSESATNNRNGGAFERRWLLLATGLE